MMKKLVTLSNLRILAAIIGAMLVMAVAFWWLSRPSAAINAVEQLPDIVSNIRKTYAHKASYWGLNNQALRGNNILINFDYKDNQLVNALGKPVLIGRGEDGDIIMPGEKSFDIVFGGLSTKECIQIVTYRFEQQATLGLLQVTIFGEKSQSFDWGSATHKLPVTRPEAERFCSDQSKVMWTFE